MRVSRISTNKSIIHITDNWKQLYFNGKMLQVKYEQCKYGIRKTSILTSDNKIIKQLIRIIKP